MNNIVWTRAFIGHDNIKLFAASSQSKVTLRSVTNAVRAANCLLGAAGHRTVHGTDANCLTLQVLADSTKTTSQIRAMTWFTFKCVVGSVPCPTVFTVSTTSSWYFVHQLSVMTTVAFKANYIISADATSCHLFTVGTNRSQTMTITSYNVTKNIWITNEE